MLENTLDFIPPSVITREGHELSVSEELVLPVIHEYSTIKFSRIECERLKVAIKLKLLDSITRVSSTAGINLWSDFCGLILNRLEAFALSDALALDVFEHKLIALMEDLINESRKNKKLWRLHRVVDWYIWTSEHHPELGFCHEYAMQLDAMVLPGNPKGEAIRNDDDDKGPLHHSLEVPLIVDALQADKGNKLSHYQERAAVALGLAFGRNPANYAYLKEIDFRNEAPESEINCFCIDIPRIKKRELSPRDDFITEYVEEGFAIYLSELIEQNKKVNTELEVDGKIIRVDKPLFINSSLNKAAMANGIYEFAHHMQSRKISKLFQSFCNRNNIISPITGNVINVSARRFRYTLGSNLAAQGVSKKELARILDHSDTQHVHVYYEIAGRIVEHLDKAAAKELSNYFSFFKGKVVDRAENAVNGEKMDKHIFFVPEDNDSDAQDIGVCGKTELCFLDPPFSCYLCPKFQPYKDANHENVLDCMLSDREERLHKYDKARLGIQLDDVIAAVAQVVKICES